MLMRGAKHVQEVAKLHSHAPYHIGSLHHTALSMFVRACVCVCVCVCAYVAMSGHGWTCGTETEPSVQMHDVRPCVSSCMSAVVNQNGS
jgi:hypothetical protein